MLKRVYLSIGAYLYAHSYSAKNVFCSFWRFSAHFVVTLFLSPWMLELERQQFLSYNEGASIGSYVTVNLTLVYHSRPLWTDIRSTWLSFDQKIKRNAYQEMNVSLPSYLSKSTSSSESCLPAFPAEFSSAFLGDFIFPSPSMLKLIKLNLLA